MPTPAPRPSPTASETPRMALAPRRALFGVPSSSISTWSMRRWSSASMPDQRVGDLAVHRFDRVAHALAEIAVRLAVALFDRFVRAGGGARRHRRAAHRAVLQHDIHLDRGIAAAVENFAADDVGDAGHGMSRFGRWKLVRRFRALAETKARRTAQDAYAL